MHPSFWTLSACTGVTVILMFPSKLVQAEENQMPHALPSREDLSHSVEFGEKSDLQALDLVCEDKVTWH